MAENNSNGVIDAHYHIQDGNLRYKGEQLKDWNSYSRSVHVKPHLIKKRGHKCELCSKEWWLDNPIVLEVHHIDGNRTNNEYDNLQLLCCNCHATTDTWRNKKRLGHQTGI